MHSEAAKAFWKAFFITLAVMAPALVWTVLAGMLQPQPAASSQSGVPILTPGEENRLTVLVAVADDPQAFALVRLDAQQEVFRIAVLPGESVVRSGQKTLTLAESYAAAGPARAAELLSDTLQLPVDRYLAVSAPVWTDIFNETGTVKAGLSGALSDRQLRAAGIGGAAQEWTASAAHVFLHALDTAGTPELAPPAAASARAVLWQAWARQQEARLPAAVPDGLRAASSNLLTNLSGTDLLTLAQTLEFLADAGTEPQAQAVSGNWNAAAARYEFDDGTLAQLQQFLSVEASAGASSGSSEP